MNKRKGFTLVELLVVIAIIALLMGILLPALARVRRSAKASACMVQVKQWSTVYSMYTGDWDGYFHADWDDIKAERINWYVQMESYYKDRNLLLCPSATKARFRTDAGVAQEGDEGGKIPDCATLADGYKLSYNMNGWLCQPSTTGESYSREADKLWQTVNRFTQPNQIPLFGDYWGHPRVWPQADTPPPATIDTTAEEGGGSTDFRIKNFCLRRHGPLTNPNVNMAFGDFSVRPVGLKALWSLNWHRQWVADRKASANRDMTDVWPDWMENYSEEGVINYN